MFSNYLKIAFRNLIRHKAFSFINVAGLAIGLASCIIIFLFVQDELSYDKYHENSDRIYRLHRHANMDVAVSAHAYGPTFEMEYPEVEMSTRFWPLEMAVRNQNNELINSRVFFADSTAFKMFSWELVKGDPNEALVKPNSVVLSESAAEKFYGTTDVLGKDFYATDGDELFLQVSGVMKDFPSNSHFRADIFVSYTTLNQFGIDLMNNWYGNAAYTYILMPKGFPKEELEAKFPAFLEKYIGDLHRQYHGDNSNVNDMRSMTLISLENIHLHSNLEFEIEPNGNMSTVYVMIGIALLIIVIASINYMNLSTARSIDRAKEVGMRKVIGADKKMLVNQFLGESVIVSFISLLIALGLAELFMPVINSFTGKELSMVELFSTTTMLVVAGVTLLIGLFAGSYPALFLSSFRPVEVLKGKFRFSGKGVMLRKGLVIVQFTISIALIVCAAIIFNQLEYIQNKNLGFSKERVLMYELPTFELRDKVEAIKARALQSSLVLNATASSHMPSVEQFWDNNFVLKKYADDKTRTMHTTFFGIDENFIGTTNIELAAGRNFSKEWSTDEESAFIINETAARHLGFTNPADAVGEEMMEVVPLGTQIGSQRTQGKIVGIAKDFNYKSLYFNVGPLVMYMAPQWTNYVSFKIAPGKTKEAVAHLEKVTAEFAPEYPFTFNFMDDNFDRLYKSEEVLQKLLSYFTFLAIFVACLGLFGLSSFTITQRTKEIGIRKVLGASAAGITVLLSKDFIKLVIIANLIAFPLVYFAADKWLQDFAYRTEIDYAPFAAAFIIAVGIAVATVSLQSVKAALSNPVKSIRYE